MNDTTSNPEENRSADVTHKVAPANCASSSSVPNDSGAEKQDLEEG